MGLQKLLFGIAAFALGTLIGKRSRRKESLGTMTDHVNVSMTVEGDRTVIEVTPSAAEVEKGETVEWRTDTDGLEFEIKPKSKPKWPFVNTNPGKGRKGAPARAGQMKPDPIKDKPIGYTVILKMDGREIVLDPDIIIREPRQPGGDFF